MKMEQQTYYTILGITPNATNDEVWEAYKKQIHQYNPTLECCEAEIEIMTSISQAYKVLSNPAARSSYDFMLSLAEILNNTQETVKQKEYIKK